MEVINNLKNETMREIKFRAWDKKRNRMINHIRNIDFALGNICSEYDLDIVGGQNSGNYYRGFEHIEIMQYTGLKDKNGKGIYEGDILNVKTTFENNMADQRFQQQTQVEVGYKNGCFIDNNTETPLYKKIRTISSFPINIWTDYKIIGNMYENPELIES